MRYKTLESVCRGDILSPGGKLEGLLERCTPLRIVFDRSKTLDKVRRGPLSHMEASKTLTRFSSTDREGFNFAKVRVRYWHVGRNGNARPFSP